MVGARGVRTVLRLVLIACVLTVSTAASGVPAPPEPPAPPVNPFGTTKGLYRDIHSQASEWVRDHVRDPRAKRIQAEIASVPTARWFAGSPRTIRSEVDGYVSAAAARDELPVLVVYNIPHRDCGNHNAGGLPDTGVYGKWIREFARGIGDRPAVVILEPDSLLLLACLDPARQEARLAALRDAVDVLARLAPHTWTYLDGSDARWKPPQLMAERLLAAGVDRARGFALNVSNYNWYRGVVYYGDWVREVLRRSGVDAHFVIDTSRSGRGPGSGNWCNPAGRALGRLPGEGGPEGVDASLWIKAPGETDGDCGTGRGQGVSGFVPELAMELIESTR